MSIKYFITYFDIFGSQIVFRFKNSVIYKSLLGGIFTLFILGLLIYLLHYFSYDCINKINPSVKEINKYNSSHKINLNTFLWAFYFTDENYYKIENPEKYFAFHAVLTKWESKMEKIPLKFSKCSFEKHFKYTNESYDIFKETFFNLNDTYCLDGLKDITLYNSNNEIPRTSLDIYVIECENKTIFGVQYDNCASKMEISKVFKSILINSFFADSYIDSNDFYNVNKYKIRKDSILLKDPEYCATLFISNKYSTSILDRGWIFEDLIINEKIQISSYIPDAVPNSKKSHDINILLNVVLFTDITNTTTLIKYVKIQDVLANLGGIINFMTLLFKFIIHFINYYNMSFDLFSSAYMNNKEFKIKFKSQLDRINHDISIDKDRLVINKITVFNDLQPNKFKDTYLKTGLSRYIYSYYTNKYNYKCMNIIHNKISKELEITNFLKLKEEFYILKALIFNINDAKIFNHTLNFNDALNFLLKDNIIESNYDQYINYSLKEGMNDKIMDSKYFENLSRRLKCLNILNTSN